MKGFQVLVACVALTLGGAVARADDNLLKKACSLAIENAKAEYQTSAEANLSGLAEWSEAVAVKRAAAKRVAEILTRVLQKISPRDRARARAGFFRFGMRKFFNDKIRQAVASIKPHVDLVDCGDRPATISNDRDLLGTGLVETTSCDIPYPQAIIHSYSHAPVLEVRLQDLVTGYPADIIFGHVFREAIDHLDDEVRVCVSHARHDAELSWKQRNEGWDESVCASLFITNDSDVQYIASLTEITADDLLTSRKLPPRPPSMSEDQYLLEHLTKDCAPYLSSTASTQERGQAVSEALDVKLAATQPLVRLSEPTPGDSAAAR